MENKEITAVTDEVVQLATVGALRNLLKLAKQKGYKTKDIAAFVGTEYSYFTRAINGDAPFPLLKFVRLSFLVGHNPFAGILSNEDLSTSAEIEPTE